MSTIERWRGKKPEPSPTDLAWQRRELGSLNNRIDGWDALERVEIGAVVAYGTMQCAAQVYSAVGFYEARSPAAGDAYQRVADTWMLGTELALREYFQRRR